MSIFQQQQQNLLDMQRPGKYDPYSGKSIWSIENDSMSAHVLDLGDKDFK